MSYLTQLIQLRRQQAALEAQEKNIQQQAIQEALLLYRTHPETHKIYQSGDATIILRFVTQRPKPEDHAELARLERQIKLEKEKASLQNQAEIEQLQSKILVLQQQLEQLQQTPTGKKFEDEYQALETALTTESPQLAVSFAL
jgi:hypothetical protein